MRSITQRRLLDFGNQTHGFPGWASKEALRTLDRTGAKVMTIAHTTVDRAPVVHAGRTRGDEDAAPRSRVLVVDDDEQAGAALANMLRADGFATSTAADGETALAEVRRQQPHVVLTDLQMHPLTGVELCRRLHEIERDLPVIVMTAHSDMRSVMESLRVGAEDYLIKPLEYDAVGWCVERAMARRTEKLEQDRQRAQLNTLLGTLNEGVAIADPSGRLLMVNEAARAMLGVGVEDLRTLDALHDVAICNPKGRPLRTEQRPLTRALRGEHFVNYEVLVIKRNGESRRIVSPGTSTRGDRGRVSLAIVLFRDVTELRCLEQQRDEYLALISHDLRNLLSSTLIFLSTLNAPARKAATNDVNLAARAERNVWRMSAMIEQLTQPSNLESLALGLRRVKCDLRELVTGVVELMDDARARRITIETDDRPPYFVLADPPELERLVTNLLTNALKYSANEAPVRMRLTRKGTDVELDVIDCGIGIAKESLVRLFDRHYRTTAAKAYASGLGLGLYIARQIVEVHGGQIQVSSEVGKGSVFRVTLPSDAASGQFECLRVESG